MLSSCSRDGMLAAQQKWVMPLDSWRLWGACMLSLPSMTVGEAKTELAGP